MSQYIYFYGHKTGPYICFSNFYPCMFKDKKYTYNCSEQFFMKVKQETFDPDNEQIAQAIMTSSKPTEIKKLGRQVHNYNEDIWKSMRYNVMLNALRLKFSQNDNLCKLLLDTGEDIIVEANPFDRIWSIGIGIVKAQQGTPWRGQNLLGKALMEIRKELKK